jgi:hypothetical protein
MKRRSLLKLALIGSMALALLAGCGKAADEGSAAEVAGEVAAEAEAQGADGENVGLANPWVESSESEILETLGLKLNVPDGATDVTYLMSESLQMMEMDFVLDGGSYTARVCADGATEVTDISGMYYEWEYEEDDTVANRPAKVKICMSTDPQAEVICWVDAVPGLSYSLSTTGPDLNGLDIAVIAEAVFAEMQGDAE